MRSFIKRLFKDRHKTVDLILLDDTHPGKDDSYKIKPNYLFVSFGVFAVMLAIVISLLFMLTPLGGLLYSADEVKIKNQIEDISERILALQDSLDMRDQQLRDIKTVIRTNSDTTLTLDERLAVFSNADNSEGEVYSGTLSDVNIFEQFRSGDFTTVNILENTPDFPAQVPVSGTLTRNYEPQEGHYGLDIASTENEEVINVADGTVISSGWTIDYGYVISVQHKEGVVSTYKHCAKLYRAKGEKVLKGDVLGLVGDTGITSSGPHLHFEIWKNGISQNPIPFLIF